MDNDDDDVATAVVLSIASVALTVTSESVRLSRTVRFRAWVILGFVVTAALACGCRYSTNCTDVVLCCCNEDLNDDSESHC